MKKTRFRIRSIWIIVMGLSLMLSACTAPQDIKEPNTIDVSASVMTRVLVNNGESYGNTQSLILTNPQISAIAVLVDFEAWTPIFKPIYHYTVGFGLIDANENKFEFAIYDNKLLVVVTSNNKIYYFECPKSIFTSIKMVVDDILQAHLALPEHRVSIFVSAMVRNDPVYMGWSTSRLSQIWT